MKVVLASGAALASVNIWTGAPLLALWVGSHTVDDDGLSMFAVFVVVAVLAVTVLALVAGLGWISVRYDRLTGRPVPTRRPAPWLRSMRGEREALLDQGDGITMVERLVVCSVVACVITFEGWFFFFAGSPLGAA